MKLGKTINYHVDITMQSLGFFFAFKDAQQSLGSQTEHAAQHLLDVYVWILEAYSYLMISYLFIANAVVYHAEMDDTRTVLNVKN